MKFQHDLKSYEHLIHEHSEKDCDTSIDFFYDGSVVLVPLIDYNSLISRLEEAEEEVSSLQQALQTKSKAINKLREKTDEVPARRTKLLDGHGDDSRRRSPRGR